MYLILKSCQIYKLSACKNAGACRNFVSLTKFQYAPAYLHIGSYALDTKALKPNFFTCVCVCVCVYSNSRNGVPRVAQRYGTIAAHTRRRASVLVVFVVFCMHMHSLVGLIRRTPPPTFSDTAITDRHSDTTIFQLKFSLLLTIPQIHGWMTCYFTSFSTVFQSYKNDGRVIMKGRVQ